MSVITSRHHPIVREFRELARGRTEALLLDGWHLLDAALRAGIDVTTVALCGPVDPADQATLDDVRRTPAGVVLVSAAVMQALSPVRSPSGVVAIARRPSVDRRALLSPAPALVLVAVGVQDPGNVGALIRSAAAAGASGVVVDDMTADPWGWKALRAGMGSTFLLPVSREPDLALRIDEWRAAGIAVVAAVPRDGQSLYDVDWTAPTAVLLGGEGGGLPPALTARATARVCIPMRDGVESLNVAVAAAIIAYEARRKRTLAAARAGIVD